MTAPFLPWKSRLNAEVYDRFVREFGIYRWLNARLAELARVEGGKRVLDLACGTGATTLACLPHMPAWSEIVGVDAFAEMVAVARANVHDPRARFEVATAASVHEVVGGAFDRVVCNAAFWQFSDVAEALDALGEVTKVGALFVFNVPAELVVGEPSTVHPFQVALLEEIRSEGGPRASEGSGLLEPEMLEHLASERGFRLEVVERHTYRCAQGELAELMSIPAMIGQVAVGLKRSARKRVLERAKERTDLREVVSVPWLYFRFERVDGA